MKSPPGYSAPPTKLLRRFRAATPSPIARKDLDTSQTFFHLLGIALKVEKARVGTTVSFLGLEGIAPHVRNGRKSEIRLTTEKARRRSSQLREALSANTISQVDLEKVIGRLSFSQTSVFGKFARAQMLPFYTKLYRRKYIPQLSPLERFTFRWRIRVLKELKPRIPRGGLRPTDFVVYTDAAARNLKLRSIILHGDQTDLTIQLLTTGSVPSYWREAIQRTNLIYGLEPLTPLVLLANNIHLFRNSTVNLYLDNNNAIARLVRGDSSTGAIDNMVAQFWYMAQKYNVSIWISRVPSKLNIADLPTRGNPSLSKLKGKVASKNLFKLLTECN